MNRKIIFILLLILTGLYKIVSADAPTINVNIDYKTNIVTISGVVDDSSDYVTMYVENSKNSLVFIGSKTVKNGIYSFKIGLLNPIDGNHKITLKVSNFEEHIISFFEYDSKLRKNVLEIYGTEGSKLLLYAGVENHKYTDEIYTLKYPADKVSITDLSVQYYGEQITSGIYGNIEIISIQSGVIKFRYLESSDKKWSGDINIFKFESIVNDNLIFELSY